MKGSYAQYTERRSENVPDDGREIVMEGEHASYREFAGVRTAAAEAPEAEMPTSLSTDAAQAYWRRLQRAGFVDEHCMLLATTTRQQTWYIAELFAEKLQLGAVKWKPFQDWWRINNLAQEKKHAQDMGLLPARYEEIDKVFED